MSIKVAAYCRVSTDSTDQLAAEIKEKQSQLEGYEDIYAMQPNNCDRLKD